MPASTETSLPAKLCYTQSSSTCLPDGPSMLLMLCASPLGRLGWLAWILSKSAQAEVPGSLIVSPFDFSCRCRLPTYAEPVRRQPRTLATAEPLCVSEDVIDAMPSRTPVHVQMFMAAARGATGPARPPNCSPASRASCGQQRRHDRMKRDLRAAIGILSNEHPQRQIECRCGRGQHDRRAALGAAVEPRRSAASSGRPPWHRPRGRCGRIP